MEFLYNEIDMQYEEIARLIFNSNFKGDDPWNYSNASFYHNFCEKDIDLRARKGLSIIICKLAIDNFKKADSVDDLIELEEKVWIMDRQEDAIQIIQQLRHLYKEKYSKLL